MTCFQRFHRYKLICLAQILFFAWHTPLWGQGPYDLLIKDVHVVDVKKGKTLPARNVFIDDGKIVKVTGTIEKGVKFDAIVDGSGKYLIPGLWDMHTHNWWQLHFSNDYVANGVLGVRNMYTPMRFVGGLRDSINQGLLVGPKYFAAGRVVEGPNPGFPDWLVVDSKEKIGPALDTLQMEGSDFVKVYNKVPREVYFELVKEAHKRGLTVQGHLPMAVSAIEASNAGQISFEHLLGIPDMCTHDHLFEDKHSFNWFAAMMNEDDYGTVEMDEKLAREALPVLRKNNTYVCPTLVVWHNYLHPDLPFEEIPLLAKYPKDMLDYWSGTIGNYRKKDADYKAMALKKYETMKRATLLLYQNGVPMLAGTDAINPYCLPGYSLHRELELLHECGIPNSEVLKMATSNAAEFMKLADHGQVKAGYVASVVLLEGDPLLDIRNTSKINRVILKGKVLDPSELSKQGN